MKHGTLLHTVAALARRIALAGLLVAGTGHAAADDQGMLVVSGERQSIRLDHDARVLEDPSGTLDAGALFSAPYGGEWRRASGGHFTAGYSDSAWWIRLALGNTDAVPRERVLSILEPSLDDVVLYTRCDGMPSVIRASGDRLAWARRALPDRNVSFPVLLPAHTNCRLLLRVRSADEISLPLLMQDTLTFAEARSRDSLVGGLMLGMLMLLLILSVALYGTTRQRELPQYIALLAAQLLVSLSLTGFGYAWLWPSFPSVQNVLPPIAIALAWIATSRLSLHALGGGHEAHWPRRAFGANWIVAILLAIALTLHSSARLFTGLMLDVGIGVLMLLAYTAAAAFGGQRRAFGLSTGTAVVCLAALVEITRALGLHGLGDNDKMPLLAGFLAQALLFGFALLTNPGHGWHEREDRRRLDREVRRRVAERTQELSSTVARLTTVNRELDRLSCTDALTGTFNRRFMDVCLGRMAQEMHDRHAPLALILFDLDYFKRVNDTWGHQAGDECLRQVAARVRRQLRDQTDALCRYGGEEFAVILPGTDLEGAQRVAEKIRVAVASTPVELPDGTQLSITISLGVSCFVDDEDCRRLVAVADRALYGAKKLGRNRWEAEAA